MQACTCVDADAPALHCHTRCSASRTAHHHRALNSRLVLGPLEELCLLYRHHVGSHSHELALELGLLNAKPLRVP